LFIFNTSIPTVSTYLFHFNLKTHARHPH
jgi:hypothetical protein